MCRATQQKVHDDNCKWLLAGNCTLFSIKLPNSWDKGRNAKKTPDLNTSDLLSLVVIVCQNRGNFLQFNLTVSPFITQSKNYSRTTPTVATPINEFNVWIKLLNKVMIIIVEVHCRSKISSSLCQQQKLKCDDIIENKMVTSLNNYLASCVLYIVDCSVFVASLPPHQANGTLPQIYGWTWSFIEISLQTFCIS